MRARARRQSLAAGAAALAACLSVAACGGAGPKPRAAVPERPCPATVVEDLLAVVRRVYRDGVASERTVVAKRTIAASVPLREAVQAGSRERTLAAARMLVATGRMSDVRVLVGGHVLAAVGGPALAPIHGVLLDAAHRPIAQYVASVWSDQGFLAETQAIAEGVVALRDGTRSLAGSMRLPAGLGIEGSTVIAGEPYQYGAFPALSYPAGHLRIYLLRSDASTRSLCGPDSEETTVRTMSRVARLIYDGEAGRRTLPQVRRVQRDEALLAAVAARSPTAVRAAVIALLNQHIVRLRVFGPAELLADVGGPYVLAPVQAPLRLAGRTIGRFVLSIQDDEGYLRLTRRLVGLSVLMYMGSQLVKNSLGPDPGIVPETGPYEYRDERYRVYTLHAHAFPEGALTIRVLIPMPYA